MEMCCIHSGILKVLCFMFNKNYIFPKTRYYLLTTSLAIRIYLLYRQIYLHTTDIVLCVDKWYMALRLSFLKCYDARTSKRQQMKNNCLKSISFL